MSIELTQAQLQAELHYDPLTGIFTRRKEGPKLKIGDRTGWVNAVGYWQITIAGKTIAAHRLAWLYMTGNWPQEDTDHVNQIKTDNSWSNLRAASRSANMFNTPYYSGKGVRQRGAKWEAVITPGGVPKRLGMFKTLAEANAAYKNAWESLS